MPKVSEHVKDGRTTLFLSGRFDFPIHKAFQAAIEHAKHSKPRIIALNFTDVTFIDSAGLGMLMLAFNNVKEAEINLILEVPPGLYCGCIRSGLYEQKNPHLAHPRQRNASHLPQNPEGDCHIPSASAGV